MTHQPLTAAWRVIATSRSASSPWSWRLSDAEMQEFHAANTAGSVDTEVLTYSDGERVMRARDKQAAAAARLAAYRGEQAPPVLVPRVVRKPPARPTAGPTLVPFANDPARW